MDDRIKQFRAWDVRDGRREIFCPEDSLPEDDLVFFLLDLIPQLDLTAIYGFDSNDLRGPPPFHVERMTTWRVYADSVGVFSRRKIAWAGERHLAFLAIVGNDRPDFRTLSDFRKPHQAARKPLFLEVLRVAGPLGLVPLGNLSTDGTKIMKRGNQGFDYCFNAQAVVDSAHQIIVAAEATAAANDKQQAVPLAKATVENWAAAGIAWPRDAQGEPQSIPHTADSGYFSEGHVRDVTTLGFDPYDATGRQKHHAPPAADLTESEAAVAESPKEAMSRKLRTESGRQLSAARQHIVEPVFGQIQRVRGFRQFLWRGLELVSAEWQLICLTHNLLKIWRFTFSLR